jgi:hypothetical protein
MFEPSRLAGEHLADAYAQWVPRRARKATRTVPEATADPQDATEITRRRS